jgi:hypothetical protein
VPADTPAVAQPVTEMPPPAPPRPVTSKAHRQSWVEPAVRPWWLAAFVLFLILVWFVASALIRSHRGRRLAATGLQGTALVTRAADQYLAGKVLQPDPRMPVTLEVTLPGREPYTLENVTLPDHRQPVIVGHKIPIWVDPQDAKVFTTRGQFPLVDDMLAAWLLGPPVLLALVVALWQRRRMLALWRTGEAAVAVVVTSRMSPIAPLSRLVQLTLREDRTGRTFSALEPATARPLAPGDQVWVVVPPRRPTRALLASLYH